jgi:hypothetical protein
VKLLGRASASQVIAAYRHDFVVEQQGKPWPEAPLVPIAELPLRRLALIAEAGRPLFFPLEAVWDLYELTQEELWRVAAMWGDPAFSMPLCELLAQVRDGRYQLSAANQENHRRLQQRIRDGTFRFGELVACYASVLPLAGAPPPPPGVDYLGLLDGHHRVLALGLLGHLPSTVRVFVGSLPTSLGVAVLNGIR